MDYSFNFNDLDELEFQLSESNSYNFNGKAVPRVTKIISKMIHEDFLMYWSNNLGFKREKYKTVLNKAADFGSKTHKGIEIFLKEDRLLTDFPYFPQKAFMDWWNKIRLSNKVEILGQETQLVCEYYGGTYDLLLSINDKPWLIDFKTSNKVSYKYFLQLAAYNRVLREYKNINLGGVMILQLEKHAPIFHEYFLDFSNKDQLEYIQQCERTFMAMLYAYYQLAYIERRFSHVVNSSNFVTN